MPAPPDSILVICIRRLGDVLLTTPLIASLRAAYPQARIDALVMAGTEGVLAGNPHLDGVRLAERGRRRLPFAFREYALAISTQENDRPHLYALLAGRRRIGIVPGPSDRAGRWKRWHCAAWCENDSTGRHTVEQMLRLADRLGIPRQPRVVPPQADPAEVAAALPPAWAGRPYAVLHLAPMFPYKAWTADGWRALVADLLGRGLDVLVSGGPAASERALADTVLAGVGDDPRIADRVGRLSLATLAGVIAGAAVYVGPDTSVTHVAAATGVPVVTLFGPSNPKVWAPWPNGHRQPGDTPWQFRAPLQRLGTVTVVQGDKPCVPCLLEGCERRLDSRSACLDELPAARVIAAVQAVLP